MANVKYTDLLNEVMPSVPGAALPLVTNEIRNAVIVFCQRSTVWRYWLDPQTVVAGVNSYDFDPPSGAEVVQVIRLCVDGMTLAPASEENLPADWQTVRGDPSSYLQQDTASVFLSPVPDAQIPNGLTMTVALAPSRISESFPTWIWNRYFEGIAAGAKANLMKMPEKPWTNPKAALYFQDMFDAAIAAAATDAARSLTRAPVRTTSYH